jgi:ribose 5-phosphate isomerase B
MYNGLLSQVSTSPFDNKAPKTASRVPADGRQKQIGGIFRDGLMFASAKAFDQKNARVFRQKTRYHAVERGKTFSNSAARTREEPLMKIGIGNDHAAVELKNIISEHLKERGCEVVNFGTDTSESFDYPIAGYKVGKAVANGDVDLGILICGTGVGISLAANKVEGVRAVVCSEPFSAKLSRMHNNTNVLAFGARVVGSELAKMIVDEWLDAEFEGGRHERRVNLLNEIDQTRGLKVVDEA